MGGDVALSDARLLDGKVAVVTGGGAGIGGSISALFAEHAASVMLVEIDPERAAGTVSTITGSGGRAAAVVADVLDPATPGRVLAAVEERFGACDILVNNVGHYLPRSGEFASSSPDTWAGCFEVNVGHVLRMTREFLPGMLARNCGTIINVSSVEAMRGYPPDPVYGAMKAATFQFTRSLGLQVAARGVRVCGIAPDVTDTPQVPYHRLVPPDQAHMWDSWVPEGRPATGLDQAMHALYLASELNRMTPGLTIPVDGGTLAAGSWYRTSGKDGTPPRWTNRPDT